MVEYVKLSAISRYFSLEMKLKYEFSLRACLPAKAGGKDERLRPDQKRSELRSN